MQARADSEAAFCQLLLPRAPALRLDGRSSRKIERPQPCCISDEIGVGFRRLADRRRENRREDADDEGEKRGVGAAWMLAHDIRLVAEQRGERREIPRCDLQDFRFAVTP